MRKLRSRRFCFEALERRAMFAGVVDITLMNNTLQFTGDTQGNHLIIVGRSGQAVEVTGASGTLLSAFGGTPTAGPLQIAGGFNNILVDLNAGNDTLEMNHISAATIAIANITIATDEGADVVRMGAYQKYAQNPGGIVANDGVVNLTGVLQIDTGTGADLLQAISVNGGTSWDLDLGDSDGTNNNNDGRPENNFPVTLDDQAYIFIGSGNAVDVNGGSGDDLVNINYLTTTGVLAVSGVAGNDVLSSNGCAFNSRATLAGGAGADTIAVDFSRHNAGAAGLIELDGGTEGDFILFARSLVQQGTVTITTGSGSDRVVIGRYYANAAGNLGTGGNVAGSINLNTDSDSDVADIRGNDVQTFFGNLGSGNDNVDFLNNIVRSGGLLDGGLDSDRLTFLGNLVTGFGTSGFEAFDSVFESDFS